MARTKKQTTYITNIYTAFSEKLQEQVKFMTYSVNGKTKSTRILPSFSYDGVKYELHPGASAKEIFEHANALAKMYVEQAASWTEERKAEAREKSQAYWTEERRAEERAKWTDKRKAEASAIAKAEWTDERKAQASADAKAYWTDERKAEAREKSQAYWTPERKAEASAQAKLKYALMSDEQKEANRQKSINAQRAKASIGAEVEDAEFAAFFK